MIMIVFYLHRYNNRIHSRPFRLQVLSVCNQISSQSIRVDVLTHNLILTLVCACVRNLQARLPTEVE